MYYLRDERNGQYVSSIVSNFPKVVSLLKMTEESAFRSKAAWRWSLEPES